VLDWPGERRKRRHSGRARLPFLDGDPYEIHDDSEGGRGLRSRPANCPALLIAVAELGSGSFVRSTAGWSWPAAPSTGYWRYTRPNRPYCEPATMLASLMAVSTRLPPFEQYAADTSKCSGPAPRVAAYAASAQRRNRPA
jgi:hypothetical protein